LREEVKWEEGKKVVAKGRLTTPFILFFF